MAPEKLKPRVSSIIATGTEVGLLVSMIARPTREEAIQHAAALIGKAGDQAREFQRHALSKSDSVGIKTNFWLAENGESDWLTRCLWTGAIPYLGAPAIALVGSYDDIAAAMLEYKSIGVSQFLLMGWPDLEEMTMFSREVLPRVRALESRANLNDEVLLRKIS